MLITYCESRGSGLTQPEVSKADESSGLKVTRKNEGLDVAREAHSEIEKETCFQEPPRDGKRTGFGIRQFWI